LDFQVVIVGGGIHGVGLLHDLSSRRIEGVHLFESHKLSCGTSSRSTKLLHGGIRYLEHFSQWPLVREALHERGLLLNILKDVVKPLPFVLPVFKGDRPSWMIQTGLMLYDTLAGDSGLPRARRLTSQEVHQWAPYLKNDIKSGSGFESAFLYYDGQMLDDVIVFLAAHAAQKMGGSFSEHSEVLEVTPFEKNASKGFKIKVSKAGKIQEFTSKMVFNTAGAWNNANLLKWGYEPLTRCLLNIGSHIVYHPNAVQAMPDSSAACLLQNKDGRVVFFIPWFGKWLFGTTESILPAGDPRGLKVPTQDIAYLTEAAKHGILINPDPKCIDEIYAGVRTMPFQNSWLTQLSSKQENRHKYILEDWAKDPFSSPFYVGQTQQNISALSRETIIDEVEHNLVSVYGGKYTTYRAQCAKLGALAARRLQLGGQSGTAHSQFWFLDEARAEHPELFVPQKALRHM
jgi:glycerol-3-phosphate dehydrogenase